MSVLAGSRPAAPGPADAAPSSRRRLPLLPPQHALWPLLAAVANAVAFLAVRPNVGDLQAALARQSAAASGVGLTYWFEWFGGGASPGSYSVLTPLISTVIGAPLVGALATVAVAPLARRALAGTAHPFVGAWIAVLTTGADLWAGRIPFALGCAVAIPAVIGIRERRLVLAVVSAVLAMLCSPVPGAFLAFGLVAVALRLRQYRGTALLVCAASGVTFLLTAVVFGGSGPQGYAVASGLLTAASCLAMVLARPAVAVRSVLWWAALAAVVLTTFPNAMGSNWTRLPWICLPAAVVATATARRWVVALAVAPAVALGVNATVVDLVRSQAPSASAAYYRPLIRQLSRVPGLADHRLEVVSNPIIHTAAYALLGHAALAGGYETQEQNQVNGLLADRSRLDPVSYKVWLDNNAVGYVALDRTAVNTSPEYDLVSHRPLRYLHLVSGDAKWLLYVVRDPTPIVPPPLRVLSATQSQLRVRVPCACTTPLRVRYSRFLAAVTAGGDPSGAAVRDDGTGWSVLVTPRPGVYVLRGEITTPLH